jgi:ATP-dependent exoDNAse (exonuclease V) beta subunit
MKLDQDQSAAVAVQTNVVVSAGAGSGKTSVLTRRYLRLVVEEHIPVARILALTFTRKAAAEMYQRIYLQLAELRDDPFVAEQIAEFDSAFISTLDSFCATIARDGCARFGIPPTFSVDEVALRERARTQAVAFIRLHADRSSIQSSLRLLGFEGFVDGLISFSMDQIPAAGGNSPSSYLEAQRQFLESHLGEQEEQISQAFATIRGLDSDGPKCVQNAQTVIEQAEGEQPLLMSSGRYNASLAPTDLAKLCNAAVRAVEACTKIKLTCGSSKHPDVPLLKDAVAALRESGPRYASLLTTLGQWSQQEELLSLLDEFYESVLAEKRQAGLLSYHDILVLAIRVLESDAPLRSYYKARFRAIMIDEFQDNNEEQKRLLYLLAERENGGTAEPSAADLDPQKLFFVGDEKQSIYRFRGADVSVFRMLADDLGGEHAQLVLGANYRSEPGLIRFFNSFFADVFANADSAYEARFLPLRHRDASPGVLPTVEHWRIEKRTQGDGDFLADVDAQAYHIAARLRRLIESQTLLVGPDARPAEYRDVAILLKSSSNQIRLERMFRLFGIPYVSGAIRSLFLEAPVNDLYNMLQLVVYPDDRVAYTAYLRSPLVGLSDEGIVRQLLAVSEGGDTAAIGEHTARSDIPAPGLFDPAAGLSAEDQRRLDRARERYEQIVAAADARPITELLFIMWYEWGYRYHLLRREEYVPYLEYFDLFWELAHSFEQRGLVAFLDEVRGHLGENQKLDELDYLGPEGEGVQIMTVHKSKGLEFPVVVVAYTENAGRNDSVSNAPYYWHEKLGPAWNIGYLPEGSVREKPANYLYSSQAEQAALEEAAERKRLLYVASTRAESHLVFCGIADDRRNSFNELITPAFEVAREEIGRASCRERV